MPPLRLLRSRAGASSLATKAPQTRTAASTCAFFAQGWQLPILKAHRPWRGSLLPLGGEAALAFQPLKLFNHAIVASAAQPSGSKLSRHKSASDHDGRKHLCILHARLATPHPEGTPTVARELAPAGGRSRPRFSTAEALQPYHRCVCCAAEREQAPSPQKLVGQWHLTNARVWTYP
ncbi:hypothetical protein J3D49_005279 [Pseudomonas kilonensis]|nr:hypothetical protein [Pseudomonas kilonensis]